MPADGEVRAFLPALHGRHPGTRADPLAAPEGGQVYNSRLGLRFRLNMKKDGGFTKKPPEARLGSGFSSI